MTAQERVLDDHNFERMVIVLTIYHIYSDGRALH